MYLEILRFKIYIKNCTKRKWDKHKKNGVLFTTHQSSLFSICFISLTLIIFVLAIPVNTQIVVREGLSERHIRYHGLSSLFNTN